MAADKFGISKAHPDRQHVAEVEAVYEAGGVDRPVEPSGTGPRQHIHLDRAMSGEAQISGQVSLYPSSQETG